MRTLLINAAALAAAALLIPGIAVTGESTLDKVVTLAVVAFFFGVLNSIVRPILKLVTLPLILLTLGLFLWVINAAMLLLTSWAAGKFTIGFHVDGWPPAMLGALIVSFVAWILGRDDKNRRSSRR